MQNNSKKMDIVTKMALIGGSGLILIIFVVVLISLGMRVQDKNTSTTNAITDQGTTEESSVDEANLVKALAVIKKVDSKNNQLTVLDIETEKNIVLRIDGAVDIKDEYGTLLTLAQLSMGDMIETKYDETTMRPENVYITAQTWERKNITDIFIDTDNKTVQIGNDKYNYNSNLVTTFLGTSFELTNLDPVDEIIVRGYKSTVWAIEVVKTHGYILLENYSKYIGGTIEIDKTTYPITDEMRITVGVGVHNIVISKEGMIPYNVQTLVEENQEAKIDVGEAQFQKGIVSFVLTPSDVLLYIDDVLQEKPSEPIPLDFGTYTIRIEKEGYESKESELTVDQAFMTVPMNIEESSQMLHVDVPAESGLYVDGIYAGEIPVETPITPGPHTLTIAKEGYYTKMYVIQIEDDGNDSFMTFPELVPMTTTTEATTVSPTDETTTETTLAP